ncbi:unnamed protein product, partial [Rhizoctonia solani]
DEATIRIKPAAEPLKARNLCKHSPPLHLRVICVSPNTSLMRLFMAGSWNMHPWPDLHEKSAGPLISSTYAPLFSAQHTACDALALDLVAVVLGGIGIIPNFESVFAMIEGTVEGFHLADPELKRTSRIPLVTRKRHLRGSIREHVQDLAIWDQFQLNTQTNPD